MKNDNAKPKNGDLRVWWIPQLGMRQTFYVPVSSVEEGAKILDTLADYDLFQLENNIKPDYSNMGGLQVFDARDDHDGPDGSWVDWMDEDSGIDDPRKWMEEKAETEAAGNE